MITSRLTPTEPLYPTIELHSWEMELFNSLPVRRLKHLAHFGAGSLISPVVHSRYEHTIGVWKIAAILCPVDITMRTAAIVHDIGHLPFSHAVEKPLGFDHHQLTESYIKSNEIKTILAKAHLSPDDIITYLNKASALTGSKHILGIDHLDSFLRDTYMIGTIDSLPKDIIRKIICTSEGIETDLDTGLYLLKLIAQDHRVFLSPLMLAVDRLLAEAVAYHWDEDKEISRTDFALLNDYDVITLLNQSKSKQAKQIIHTLLYHPEKIQINTGHSKKGIPIHIRKIYAKTPLYQGKPLIEQNEEAYFIFNSLTSLENEYEVTIT